MSESIKQMLKLASKAYYAGRPFLSDEEFDKLAQMVAYGDLGADPPNNEIPHVTRMYSLEKFYKDEDTYPFTKETHDVIKTIKLDGAAVALTYINGLLINVATRGNGHIGQDITSTTRNSGLWPTNISLDGVVQITGEVVAFASVPNSRNYAAGALSLKDPEEFKSRNLTFFAYGINPFQDLTYDKDMYILNLQGFLTVRNAEPDIYPSDGIVVRLNDNDEYLMAGHTAKHPKGAYCIKDKSDFETKTSTLRNVVWQLGKGGKITPVAEFDEVVIEDAKINRATLHNAGFVEALDLHIGDILILSRAGGIIPKVIGKE